jgi:hypothetical protein
MPSNRTQGTAELTYDTLARFDRSNETASTDPPAVCHAGLINPIKKEACHCLRATEVARELQSVGSSLQSKDCAFRLLFLLSRAPRA